MAKNSLSDLNNHLFAQLERLGDEDLTKDQLQVELDRARAINGVAKNIIDNARVTLDGAKFVNNEKPLQAPTPDLFKLKE